MRNTKPHKNSRYLNSEPSCEITLGDTNLQSCVFWEENQYEYKKAACFLQCILCLREL